MKLFYKAFTLSEVLISLTVIGVIAAITVPTLLQKYQEQSVKSALKKNYSVLKSALDKYQVENGERILPSDVGARKFKALIIKYVNIMTDCGIGCSDQNTACISSSKNIYKTYNKKSSIAIDPYFDDGQFILNDGSLILIENNFDANSATASRRLYISVDINGYKKKPNQLGKDLFMFQITNNGDLLPMGAKGTDFYSATNGYCSNTSTNNMNGAGCSAKVLRE